MWSNQTIRQDPGRFHPIPVFTFILFIFSFQSPTSALSLSLSGPMLTFWLMEKQQLRLRGTDMRLESANRCFHWKHLEVYMGGK